MRSLWRRSVGVKTWRNKQFSFFGIQFVKAPSAKAAPRVRVRVLADSLVAMGPGKADLLDAIASTGSISAAARSMGMSYRRAWILRRRHSR